MNRDGLHHARAALRASVENGSARSKGITALAEEHGVSPATVRRWLHSDFPELEALYWPNERTIAEGFAGKSSRISPLMHTLEDDLSALALGRAVEVDEDGCQVNG